MAVPSRSEFIEFLTGYLRPVSPDDCQALAECVTTPRSDAMDVIDQVVRRQYEFRALVLEESTAGQWLSNSEFFKRAFQKRVELQTAYLNRAESEGRPKPVPLTPEESASRFAKRLKKQIDYAYRDGENIASMVVRNELIRMVVEDRFSLYHYYTWAVAYALYEYHYVFNDEYIAENLQRSKKISDIKENWSKWEQAADELKQIAASIEADPAGHGVLSYQPDIVSSLSKSIRDIQVRIKQIEQRDESLRLIIKRNDATARERLYLGSLFNNIWLAGARLTQTEAEYLSDIEGIQNNITDIRVIMRDAHKKWGSQIIGKTRRWGLILKMRDLTPPELIQNSDQLTPVGK